MEQEDSCKMLVSVKLLDITNLSIVELWQEGLQQFC
jgi:hypothetical protein